MSQEQSEKKPVYWVGNVGVGPGEPVTHPQTELGLGTNTGNPPKIGNFDKSLWKTPEFKGNFHRYPTLGWASIDLDGKLPPYKKPFGPLPPGVTPAVSPLDRERLRRDGAVYTVSDGKYGQNPNLHSRIFESIMTANAGYLLYLSGFWKNLYHSLQIYPTEPRYHIRLPPVTPIWDCHVNDVWCVAHADKRATVERRIDHNTVKLIQNRLTSCHRAATGQEHKNTAKQYAYEYLCGELDETLKETEAAFELKWGRLPYRRPEHQLGKFVYLKQKNRYIEDRFRHRMMENVGASYNYDAFTASGQNPKIVDGPDRVVNYNKAVNNMDKWYEWLYRWTIGSLKSPVQHEYDRQFPTWSMDEALMIEAKKRRKMRLALEEAEDE
jgi:hypothetical protein